MNLWPNAAGTGAKKGNLFVRDQARLTARSEPQAVLEGFGPKAARFCFSALPPLGKARKHEQSPRAGMLTKLMETSC